MLSEHKYAQIERERRFLLEKVPVVSDVARVRRISDRYIDNTNLRLRHQHDENGPSKFKLTQKISLRGTSAQQGLITTFYLQEQEFHILAELSAKPLSKTRYSLPPFGIDVFEAELEGLVLAEAEFDSASEADVFRIPSFAVRDVSADDRFTGGRLAQTSRQELRAWLQEYDILI